MKWLLIFAVIIGLGAFSANQYKSIDELNKTLAEKEEELDGLKKKVAEITQEIKNLKSRPAGLLSGSSATGPVTMQVTCPVCHGEKVIAYGQPGNTRTDNCPVCLAKGFRVLTIPAGKKLCPDCGGMGIVYLSGQHGTASNCARCAATGAVAGAR